MENADVFELYRMARYLPELSIVRKEIGMTGQIGDVLKAMNDPLAERTGRCTLSLQRICTGSAVAPFAIARTHP